MLGVGVARGADNGRMHYGWDAGAKRIDSSAILRPRPQRCLRFRHRSHRVRRVFLQPQVILQPQVWVQAPFSVSAIALETPTRRLIWPINPRVQVPTPRVGSMSEQTGLNVHHCVHLNLGGDVEGPSAGKQHPASTSMGNMDCDLLKHDAPSTFSPKS